MSLPNSTTHHDCAGDAAAYALGALEPREARLFAAHLETCVVCRDEFGGFQEVAKALPLAAPQHQLPRGLRRRVLADFRKPGSLTTDARRVPAARPRRRFMPAPALAFGLAAVIAVATVGGLSLDTSGGPATRILGAQVYGSPGSAELRVTGDRGTLIVHHMPLPASGHVYEVWLKRSGQPPAPTSALFSVSTGGNGHVVVPDSLSHVNQVMVTQEPAGGSAVPTSGAVIVAALT